MTTLSYDVLVTAGARRERGQTLPTGEPIISSPVSTTLITGAEDAVLVDPPFLDFQIREVADWVVRSGKRLRHIFATHGHGDHWFGTAELLEHFPGAQVYATPGTIDVMHKQATDGRAQMWDLDFPGRIPPSPVLAQPVPEAGFLLEGHVLRAVDVGHTDTDATSVLHVPDLGLVVAGDTVYNGIHQYILEGGDGGLQEWLHALDRIAELEPRAVVAGHKNQALPDDPLTIDQTRTYLLDVIRLLDTKPTAREFYDEILRLHPERLNPGPVWYGAVALLGTE
ncbi:MBL fold metallo-hydrolase [Amycolatopsis sp. NPDC051372]|uniref:MBL fold metallo-hydrolase n=1 Tax=Amycolatopsis sp. NPDC051372 TaxID=3155669 RepID=UPI00342D81F6